MSPRLMGGALLLWSALALWAGVVTGSHLKLSTAKADLERVRQADLELRAMLKQSDPPGPRAGSGGPSDSDVRAEMRAALASYDELTGLLDARRLRLRATPQGWPTMGRLTSSFGRRFSPMGGEDAAEFHPGLDIANRQGTPITATADGVVRRAGWTRGYGRMLLIRHGAGFATLFGHTSKLLVKEGQRVERGQPIALMGTTGRSTGSHLHYEVWLDGRQVNPRRYLK